MDDKLKSNIIKSAKRIEENSLYAFKSHYNSAAIWSFIYHVLTIGIIIASSITIAYTFSDTNPYIIRILAIIALIFSSLVMFFNPSEKIRIHNEAGSSYSSLNSKAETFREIEAEYYEETYVKGKIFELRDKRDEFNSKYPQPLTLGYIAAKIGIWLGEAINKVDKSEKKQKV